MLKKVGLYHNGCGCPLVVALASPGVTVYFTDGEEMPNGIMFAVILAPSSVQETAKVQKVLRLVRLCKKRGIDFVIVSTDWRTNSPYQKDACGENLPIIQEDDLRGIMDRMRAALSIPVERQPYTEPDWVQNPTW